MVHIANLDRCPTHPGAFRDLIKATGRSEEDVSKIPTIRAKAAWSCTKPLSIALLAKEQSIKRLVTCWRSAATAPRYRCLSTLGRRNSWLWEVWKVVTSSEIYSCSQLANYVEFA